MSEVRAETKNVVRYSHRKKYIEKKRRYPNQETICIEGVYMR